MHSVLSLALDGDTRFTVGRLKVGTNHSAYFTLNDRIEIFVL